MKSDKQKYLEAENSLICLTREQQRNVNKKYLSDIATLGANAEHEIRTEEFDSLKFELLKNQLILFTTPKQRIRATLRHVHCGFEHIKNTANDRVLY